MRPAGPDDIESIKRIAFTTWPVAYAEILSQGQMDYMLEMMYSTAALTMQMAHKHNCFVLVIDEAVSTQALGFASYELAYRQTDKTKLHKLYVLPDAQRRGAGGALVRAVAGMAKRAAQTALTLNVNKFNNAKGFYVRLGFAVVGEEDIDIGEGFLMQDFILEMPLA